MKECVREIFEMKQKAKENSCHNLDVECDRRFDRCTPVLGFPLKLKISYMFFFIFLKEFTAFSYLLCLSVCMCVCVCLFVC